MRMRTSRWAALWLFITSVYLLQSHPLDRWHWATPRPAGNPHDIAYGTGTWVHVSGTEIFFSADGETWKGASLPYNPEWDELQTIAFGNGTFVLGGWGKSILTSTNGSNWVRHLNDHETRSIAYGAGRFLAIASNGHTNVFPQEHFWAVGSTNGVDWIPVNIPTTNRLLTISYAGDRFFAVDVPGTIFTSPDGIVWTPRYSSNRTWFHIAYGNGLFIASNPLSDGNILVSSNSIDWTLVPATSPYGSQVTFGNGKFVALTGTFTSDGQSFVGYSTNGTNWEIYMSADLVHASSTKFLNDRFVAPGIPPLASFDGRAWTPMGKTLELGARRIRYVNDSFLAFGVGTNFGVSTNGSDWTSLPISPTDLDLNDGVYANGTYVFAGSQSSNATIVTSTNLVDWNASPIYPGVAFLSLAYSEGIFLATSQDGLSARSTDAQHWNPATAPGFLRLVAGNGVFVGLTHSNVWTSTDGLTWTSRTIGPASNTYAYFIDMTFGNGRFVLMGYAGSGFGSFISTDGANWSAGNQDIYFFDGLRLVGYGGGFYVALDWFGNINASQDGLNWTRHVRFGFGTPDDVAFGDGTFLTLARGKYIAQSEPIISLDAQRHGALTLSGPRSRLYRIESSADLTSTNWLPVQTMTLTNGNGSLAVPTNSPQRFYRALLLPE
jgi:hypothetical protein